jgi:AraC-like DNA-binding protein
MPQIIDLHPPHRSELDMYNCGIEDCRPGHFFGPAVREYYLIHVIRSGKGCFQVGNQRYPLRRGQGFLICPDVVTFYQADQDDPWHYSWVGFNGTKARDYLEAAGLSQANPIFGFDREDALPEWIGRMVEAGSLGRGRETALRGLLYLFLARLIENAKTECAGNQLSKKEQYLQKAIEFIRINYSRKITVRQIAAFVGLDRSYLSALFQEELHRSPQEFLIRFRMEKARGFMANESLSIGDVARSVGYDDPLQFSKAFKKWSGLPPSRYRKRAGEDASG